jgi:hypothetical protein
MAHQRQTARLIAWAVRSLTVNIIVACLTVGIALGVTNVMVNHVHWLGAYLVACSSSGWKGEPSREPAAPLETLPAGRIGMSSD